VRYFAGCLDQVVGSSERWSAIVNVPLPESARLFSPLQVFLAAFLGGPLAGAWAISQNYRSLAQPQRGARARLAGWVAAFALLPMGLLIGDGASRYIIPLLYGACFYYYALSRFRETDAPRVEFRREWRSWAQLGLATFAWCVLTLALFIALFYVTVKFFPWAIPHRQHGA
jgi:hypothetical protein